jgi:hypothetical protein
MATTKQKLRNVDSWLAAERGAARRRFTAQSQFNIRCEFLQVSKSPHPESTPLKNHPE